MPGRQRGSGDRPRLSMVSSLLLCFAFLLSGAAALLFQTLWFRQAGLTFGNSVWASTLVLASFMGGLALGNALATRLGPRVRRPLRVYASLEAATAGAGFALSLGFPALSGLAPKLFGSLLGTPLVLNTVRLGSGFLLMLVPATAMGATLPVLVRTLARQSGFGPALGRLYGWNTLGAMAGALGGEFLLIERVGVRGTALTAALLGIVAAALALGLDRLLAAEAPTTPRGATREPSGTPLASARRLLLASFLAGGILLALEVVWFRFLLLFANGTSLTFAVMLAVVLAGIGLGGLTASAWLSLRPTAHHTLATVALLSGAATLLAYSGFVDALTPYGTAILVGNEPVVILSLKLMLPTCLASGLLFTLCGRALHDQVPDESEAAGRLTLANTSGAMLGAVAAGLVLLPRLGMEACFFALGMAYGVVALLAGPATGAARTRAYTCGLLAAAALLVGVALLFPFGLMKNRYMRIPAQRWGNDGSQVVAVREGLTETLLYLRGEARGEPLHYRLVTNGFSMSASQYYAKRYMGLFAYWPVAVHPEARKALLICFGVGTTAKALTNTSSLSSIDVVDISRDVLEMSRVVFPAPATYPLDDPRTRVHVEDGRFFLLTTPERYDIITAEPPPPKNAGIANLYSQEYFALMRERLAPGGIATYWLPVFQLAPEEMKAIVASFCSAFPDCSLWTGFGPEWMLVGTRDARGGASEEAFARQWRDPVVGAELRRIGVEFPEQLGALFLADATALRELTRGAAPLDDDHPYRLSPRLELTSHHGFYGPLMDTGVARERFARSDLIRKLWPAALRGRTPPFFDVQHLLNRQAWSVYGAPVRIGLPYVAELLATPVRTPVLWALGSSAELAEIVERARTRGVDDPRLQELSGVSALAARDYRTAEAAFRAAQESLPPQRSDVAEQLLARRVLALALGGERAQAAQLAAGAARALPIKDQATWAWLAAKFGLPRPGSS